MNSLTLANELINIFESIDPAVIWRNSSKPPMQDFLRRVHAYVDENILLVY